jgi:hypothetical protein
MQIQPAQGKQLQTQRQAQEQEGGHDESGQEADVWEGPTKVEGIAVRSGFIGLIERPLSGVNTGLNLHFDIIRFTSNYIIRTPI